MIGTWTPPGAIFTVQFDDEKLTLKLIKRTEIPQDEPISWMTFDVSVILSRAALDTDIARTAYQEESVRSCHEEMVKLRRQESDGDHP
jgi:hypothetical protein